MTKRSPQDIITEHVTTFDKEPGVLDLLSEKNNGKSDSEYDEFFRKKMKEAGFDSIEDLSDKEKKKFFDQIDKAWVADDEENEKYDSQYQKFFNKKLKEYGVNSPFELAPQKREKFFEEVDKEWKSDKES